MAAFSEKIVESFNRRGPVLHRIEGDDPAGSRRPPSTAAPSFVGPGSACDDLAGSRWPPSTARRPARPTPGDRSRRTRPDPRRPFRSRPERLESKNPDRRLKTPACASRKASPGAAATETGRPTAAGPDSTGEDATNAPGAGRLHERSRPRTGSRDGSCSGSDCEWPGGGSGRAIRRIPSCRARTRTRERRYRPPAATG